MSTQLGGFPTGLLSLLDAQNFGVNPKDLSELVSPVVDLTDLYLVTKQVGDVNLVAAPANGQNFGLIVPAGEVWKVHAGGVFVLAGAGVTLDITAIAEISGIITPMSDTISVAASTTRMIAMKTAPFWARSGFKLGAYITALVGAPTVSIAYCVSKLRS